jgi:hypothetical protein
MKLTEFAKYKALISLLASLECLRLIQTRAANTIVWSVDRFEFLIWIPQEK